MASPLTQEKSTQDKQEGRLQADTYTQANWIVTLLSDKVRMCCQTGNDLMTLYDLEQSRKQF